MSKRAELTIGYGVSSRNFEGAVDTLEIDLTSLAIQTGKPGKMGEYFAVCEF